MKKYANISFIFLLSQMSLVSLLLLLTVQTSLAQSNLGLAQSHIFKTYPHLKNQKDLNWIVTDESTSKRSQITHLYLRQTYRGIEISNQNLNVSIHKGKVVSVKGEFLKKISPKQVKNQSNKLSAVDAIVAFAQIQNLGTPVLSVEKSRRGIAKEVTFKQNNISREPIPAKLVYYLSKEGTLHLAWDFSIAEKNTAHWWSVRLDAETGKVLEKNDWTTHCSFDTPQHVHSQNCNHHNNIAWGTKTFKPQKVQTDGSAYRVFAAPLESPSHGSRTLESEPADPVASPFGWHDTNGTDGAEYTITRGNNAFAYEDADADNLPGFSPDGGSSLQFDFPIDLNLSPNSYQEALITNLFYWNNYTHDIFYHYGFDEVSGNFQDNNYGKGGVGGDEVRAEAIDGSGTNNANFQTPPEGTSGRMQMYVFLSGSSTTSLSIDSPSSISGDYDAIAAGFGPNITDVPISAEVVLVDDGTASPSEACSPITNDLTGKIALIDRGNCPFVSKVQHAQDAGALAVIMVNNVSDPIFAMGGASASITIPSVMISQANGDIIKAELANGTVEATLELSGLPNRTSDLDNGIIVHEYGHGISIRLTGGASNSNCLSNVEQMGEGWSDYFALITTMKASDTPDMPRGIGTYAVFQPTTGGGIRPAPYTTDMSINGFTYADADQVSIPHGVGFLWCTTLWDMTWLFIDRYGFDEDVYNGTGGNNRALELVMEGLKLQPCSPGFVDGRDAILEADMILNGGANQDIIWEAFARRGIGAEAGQGSSNQVGDEIISFDLPSFLNIRKIADKGIAEIGEVITYSITVENGSNETINNIDVTDDIPTGLTYVSGSASDGGSESGGTVTFPTFSLGQDEEKTLTLQATVSTTEESTLAFEDTHENGNLNWTTSSTGAAEWTLLDDNTNAYSGESFWFAENLPSTSNLALTLENGVILDSEAHLLVIHKFDLEAQYDGGIIEISTDRGNTWTNLQNSIVESGYNGTISSTDGSAIAGRQAFTGNSQGYIKTLINLNIFRSQSVKFRFRLVTDAGVGGDGWYIDDIKLYNGSLVSLTNEACVSAGGQLFCNTDFTIVEGECCTAITSLEEISKSDFISVYPNPSTDFVNVLIKAQNQKKAQILITDLQGRGVLETQFEVRKDDFLEQLDLSKLPSGLYLIKINIEGQSYISKLLIER